MRKIRERKIGIIENYAEFLSVTEKTPIISLNEGNTPLILSETLPKTLGLNIRVYYKYEGLNPTGSFKDRGMTMAVSKALEDGKKAIMCASTGNTSASAAAYAARAGVKCYVLLPAGKIAKGKLMQALRFGATVISIDGNFDQCLDIVKEITSKEPIRLVNSLNPYRIEGQKSGAYEICDDIDDAPDYHFIPVGNAGNITAYWAGYKDYKKAGKSRILPKMCGFQAKGACPIVEGRVFENPETIATAIRIGNPASWKPAEAARDESGGVIEAVTDEEITAAYCYLAEKDGVFVEPASAASLAGFFKKAKEGYIKDGSVIVCTLTGNGLKDPDFALSFDDKLECAPPETAAVMKIIKGK